MRSALRLVIGDPMRLAVTSIGLAASTCMGVFGARDFALGLGVFSTLAALTVILAVIAFAVGEATGVLTRKDQP